jgi:predicted DNA-binding transcriptional regulator YafY
MEGLNFQYIAPHLLPGEFAIQFFRKTVGSLTPMCGAYCHTSSVKSDPEGEIMEQRLVKLLKALELLSRPEGVTIKELSGELCLDRKSVYRLLDLIGDLQVPVYDEKLPGEREKRWKLVDSYVKKLPNLTVPDLTLTLPEILSLYLLKGESGLFKGTDIQARIDSGFQKLCRAIPKGLIAEIDKIKTLFVPVSKFAKDYSGKEEIIDCCTDAMLRKKSCFVQYHSFSDDTIKNFKIDPLCFFENNGGLYVFVRATTFDEIRILAVERIQGLELTEAAFHYPEDFKPDELLQSGFDIVYDDPLDVKIWFSADQARYVKERKWATNQNFTDQPDGSVTLEMETSGWWHVKKWVLSFGSEARVLEPRELADAIADELEKVLQSYRQPSCFVCFPVTSSIGKE